ncbi:TetR/AcrR family transcriptional regulator [Nocardia sp. NPDC058705]|uniref:TetR/AcrR family transcriptional regulator n=1 Tax=Nocardia sp. NPDC058705 TaxID=3346609 RepID=UPI0036838B5E
MSSSEPRPRRGLPENTRARLIRATAQTYNEFGLADTDVRRIVASAGYATGTFYRHFSDKHEALLAAWEWWIVVEWSPVLEAVRRAGSARERAEQVVDTAAGIHRKWHGLRVAMAAHAQVSPAAMAAYRAAQRGQAAILGEVREAIGGAARSRESDLLVAMTLERILDANASGELDALDIRWSAMRDLLVAQVTTALA